MENSKSKSVLVELYDEMRMHMDKAAQLMPTYLKMVDSLRLLYEFFTSALASEYSLFN